MDTQPTPTSVSPSSTVDGLALVCTIDGEVRRVERSTLEGARPGATFCDCAADTSQTECNSFLQSLRRGGFARSTPLRMGTRDVHCFGIGDANGLRIVAVIDPATAASFADSIEGFQDLAAAIRRTHEAYRLYEELARLNNDLVTSQRELARTVAELQRLNEYKDELLGMAAHDLRNPLHANAAYIAFLQGETVALTPPAQVLLDRLRKNSEYMLRLVDNMLDFAAIQSGRVRLAVEECSIEEVLDGVISAMRIIAAPRRVTIDVTCEGELPRLRVDPIKISQAVQNLIANAVQYSPEGATIEVRVAPVDGGVSIEVEDHGPGIPAEELPNLFKPFSRLSTVTLSGQRSVGLGLAITRRLIEAHGGTIDVRSEVGKGSVFLVRLRAS